VLKLVYACLAFTVVALGLLILFASQDGRGFHGATNEMNNAITQGALVLDADRFGAVTQTGNGHVTGYQRDSDKKRWSEHFDRFAEGPNNPYGAGAIDAEALCGGACPTAILSFNGKFYANGGASQEFVDGLANVGGAPGLLAMVSGEQGFVEAPIEPREQSRLYWLDDDQGQPLPARTPSDVQYDQSSNHVLVGSDKGKSGTLTRLSRDIQTWSVVGKSIDEAGLVSTCISASGDWIGAISTSIRRYAFDAPQSGRVGPAITSGRCTVDAKGITAVFTPASNPDSVEVARFAPGGRLLWSKKLGTQKLLSPAGSPYVVAQAPDGTVKAIDSLTGAIKYEHKLTEAPFVGRDGSVVNAGRTGKPQWLLVGRAPAP
jgi:outer membrane protein assembly factor BamB